MVINETFFCVSFLSLSNSEINATSSKNSLKEPSEFITSSWPSIKSLTAFNNSSMFSILLTDSGVPSAFKRLITPILFKTSSIISKAFKLLFLSCKVFIRFKKSISLVFVPLLIFISIVSINSRVLNRLMFFSFE